MRWSDVSCRVLTAAAMLLGSAFAVAAQDVAAPETAAPESAPPETPAQIDPKAAEIVDGFKAFYSGLTSVKGTSLVNASVKTQEQSDDGVMTLDITMKEPGKIKIISKADTSEAHIGSDGSMAYIYVPELKQYMQAPQPPNLGVLVMSGGAGPLQTGVTFVAELFQEQPYERLMEEVKVLSLAGEETVNGVNCNRVHVEHPEMTWDMWIDSGDQPWLIKAVPDVQEQLKARGHADIEMSISVECKGWSANPELADDLFAFAPPEGVKKVEQFGAPPEFDGPNPLLGKPAPETKLELLDGSTVELASLKDKKIVILDFWATWCGPCKKFMPIISKVTKDYADKDVVLYAVNVREDAERIKAFLESQGLDVTAALDKDGAIGDAYYAASIPQTVIIGKDGTVQVVHVGVADDTEAKIREYLDALVKGENVAEKTLKEAESAGKMDGQSMDEPAAE